MPDGTVARVGIPQIEELLAAYSLFSQRISSPQRL